MDTFLRDLRIGLRVLIKEKGFCALAVTVLALGICGVTTIFSVINATLIRDYCQRPFQRLQYDVSGTKDGEAVYAGVMDVVAREARPHAPESDAPAPIIEMSLRGHLGFSNSLLPLKKMRDDIKTQTHALHVILQNRSVPVEYAVAAGLESQAPRHERERHIIEGLVMQNNLFKTRAAEMAELIVAAKKYALNDEGPDKIFDLIEQTLHAPASNSANGDTALLALARNAAVNGAETAAMPPDVR